MDSARTSEDLAREDYEERRRKWRRSGFFRGVLAVTLVISLISFAGFWLSDGIRRSDHIAMVDVRGVIVNDPKLHAELRTIENSDTVQALILRIDSPGGTVVGSEALYEHVRRIASGKPVVAIMGEAAASGGYVAAIAADHLIARGNTITGSIGVILEYPQITELLDRIGVDFEVIRSSDLKGGASPFRETTPEQRAVEQALIEDSYQWFRGLVGDRRNLAGGELDAVSNGRVFTGRQALQLGLIDAIGGYDEALDWLDSHDSVSRDLPVDLYEPQRDQPGFLGPLGQFLAQQVGWSGISRLSGPRLYSIAR